MSGEGVDYPESGSTTGHGDPHGDLDFFVAENRGVEPFSRLRPLTVNHKQDTRIELALRIVKHILQAPPMTLNQAIQDGSHRHGRLDLEGFLLASHDLPKWANVLDPDLDRPHLHHCPVSLSRQAPKTQTRAQILMRNHKSTGYISITTTNLVCLLLVQT